MPTAKSPARGASLLARQLKLGLSFLKGRPQFCCWQATNRCNYRCVFCRGWRRTDHGRELTVDQLADVAKKLAKMGTMIVAFGGGESFLRPDFADVVRAVSRYHLCWVTTNGSLITRERAREVIDAGLWGIGVSIDYADAERHDAHRGVKGAYEHALNALECLSKERAGRYPRIVVTSVLLDDNIDELPKLATLAQKHHADFLVQPYSRIKTGDEKLSHRGPVARKMLKLKEEFPNLTSNPVFLERFDEAITVGVGDCTAGRYMMNIDPQGRVSECDELTDHPLGNILTDDVPTLLERLHARHRANKCRHCWNNCRGEMEATHSLRGMLFSLATNFKNW